MDMNETNLTIVDYRDVEKKGEVKRLYRKAFPREERAPWLRLMRAYNEWDCAIEAYYHGKTFIGFTVELERTEFIYLFFFAVSRRVRGKGYGKKILRSVTEGFRGKTVVIDIEAVYDGAPNLKEREKRKSFYLSQGFISSGLEFIVRGVKYETMYFGEDFDADAYRKFIEERVLQFKA